MSEGPKIRWRDVQRLRDALVAERLEGQLLFAQPLGYENRAARRRKGAAARKAFRRPPPVAAPVDAELRAPEEPPQ